MRLIHITDPHLSSLDHLSPRTARGKRLTGYLSWQNKRRHIHDRTVLDALCDSVAGESPDQVLVTGDLVQVGTEEEVRQAAAWLDRLGSPEQVFLVPGNHDVYAGDSWRFIQRHWGAWLPGGTDSPSAGYPSSRILDGIQLLGLSTACPTPIFSARGRLGGSQFMRFQAALADATASGRATCVLIHHPPLPGMTHWRKAMKEVRPLERLLAELAPHLVVYGHTHSNHAQSLGTTRLFSTASASLRDNASYRVFDIESRNGSWRFNMQLKRIAAEGDKALAPVDSQEWSVDSH